jgi:hypothetical protein
MLLIEVEANLNSQEGNTSYKFTIAAGTPQAAINEAMRRLRSAGLLPKFKGKNPQGQRVSFGFHAHSLGKAISRKDEHGIIQGWDLVRKGEK